MGELKVIGRFWILKDGKNFLGAGKADLLARIDKSGSINKAAKEMRMSYKAAWDSADSMNHLSPTPMINRVLGGKNGGGSEISEEGHKAIRVFNALEELKDRFFASFDECDTLDDIEAKIKELDKKFS